MQPHQVFWEICNLTNYENISYSINVLIKLLGKYFISNYPSNQNFWEICNLIKFFEKYVISSSMIFRNVSICRSCKNCIVCFIKILFWTKWIQMIFDKMPNWLWIILQLLYLQNLIKELKVHYEISDWIWYFCVMLITIWCINVKGTNVLCCIVKQGYPKNVW